METSLPAEPEHLARSRRAAVLAGGGFVVVAVAGITWAKWWPYAGKIRHTLRTHAFAGTSLLTGKARVPPGPSWHAAWTFAVSYFKAVWIALVAALVIAAAAEALLPADWLARQLGRGPRRLGGAAAGGLASLPTMMCTCCTAPLAVTFRRRGVPPASALAYWVGNPALNPAVLVFLAVVLPWQWVSVRVVAGVVLAVGVTALVSRFERPGKPIGHEMARTGATAEPMAVAPVGRRFARCLLRLSATLLPEYAVVVMLVGGLRGWLFPISGGVATWGVLALLIFAAAGALLVIPTAGEIPIIQGLLAAGVAAGPVGTLVVTLPALSLPSLVMVSRSFSWRTLAAILGAVILLGVGAGAVLSAAT